MTEVHEMLRSVLPAQARKQLMAEKKKEFEVRLDNTHACSDKLLVFLHP